MDILAHMVYGATLFSRSGVAGGRRGTEKPALPVLGDWTVWVAALFGLLPDMMSIGPFFVQRIVDRDVTAFQHISPVVMGLYHLTHSLMVAALILALLYFLRRSLFVPALAWPLHILMDSFSHGEGRWETLMFFPFSEWHLSGINWWQSPRLMALYWGLLPVMWVGLMIFRRLTRSAVR
jgi:hypothetical protein